jgi:tRNA 2-selenouridine synthase SelU
LDLRGVPNTALLAHHGIVRFNPMVGLIRFYEFTEIDETTGEVTVDPVVQVDLTPSTLSQLIAGLDNAIQQ